MTIERRLVVGLEDIKGVSLECGKCRFKMTLPLDAIDEIPKTCSHCSQEWIPINQSGQSQQREYALIGFNRSLKTIRTLMSEGYNSVRVLLEFEDPSR